MTQSHQRMLRGLKASAEPSRLRLLAVLALGEFTVSDLTAILGQSQPRVSRHLKLLSDGGLLERFREQHWVFHRVPADGEGAELVRALLELLDRDDALVALDRERATAVLVERARSGGANPDATEALAAASTSSSELARVVASELGDRAYDALFYAGPAPAEMLGAMASRARRIVGVSESRQEVQRARASLHGNGCSHCELQHGGLPDAAEALAAASTSSSELAGVVASELGDRGYDAVLYAGPAPAEMLGAMASRARRILGISESRHEVQRARASLHGSGGSHCELQHGGLPGAALAAASFDAIVLDRVLGAKARRGEWLRESARVLRAGGRLTIIEEYEAMAERAGGGNPLATMRAWIAEAGLLCERLRPADAGGMHVLVATVSPERAERAA
jgi:DNA-binding transcriptional ArsR family regulator